MFSIPAVKGIEFGAGFRDAIMFGSQHNDAIKNIKGETLTDITGGIAGVTSNGNELIFRLAIKLTSSTLKGQISLNWDTNKTETFSTKGRHALCIAIRAQVIVEAATAIAILDLMLLEQKINRALV